MVNTRGKSWLAKHECWENFKIQLHTRSYLPCSVTSRTAIDQKPAGLLRTYFKRPDGLTNVRALASWQIGCEGRQSRRYTR